MIDFTKTVVTRGTDYSVSMWECQLQSADMVKFTQNITYGHEYSNTFFVARTADYVGGKSGWVNSAGRFVTTVTANAESFEWALTGIVNNSAAKGQNVGVYGQGNALTPTTGPTWGGTFEAHDKSGTSRAAATIGMEVDVWATGADTNRNRIGVNVVTGNVDGGTSEAWAALYVSSINGTISGSYKNGLFIGNQQAPNLSVMNAVNIYCNGTTGVWDRGAKTVGFYAAGDYSGSAFRMKTGAKLSYTDTDSVSSRYDGAFISQNAPLKITSFASGYVMQSGVVDIRDDGIINLNKQKVMPSAGAASGFVYIEIGGVRKKIQLFDD